MTGSKILRCGFCGFTQTEVKKLIAGQNGACICNDCVLASVELLREGGMAPPCDVCEGRRLLHDAGHVETQQSIAEWAEQTFGPTANLAAIAARANKEMAELLMHATTCAPPEVLLEECADVDIILKRFAKVAGGDLNDAVDRKMAINRERRWIRDGHGHGYHRKVDA
jgi:hypothetical protein